MSYEHHYLIKLARSLHIRPSHSLGQNFLIDDSVLFDILDVADIQDTDAVLEIGPGLGVLTKELSEIAKTVVSVELDKKCVQYLTSLFAAKKSVHIKQQDILSYSNESITAELGNRYRVIANIPYQITGKILRKFISDESHKPENMVLLVQKEVAERICAQPGKLSLLAISVQLYSLPSLIRIVPKEAFWPAPEVTSAILSIKDISEKPRFSIKNIDFFWRVVKIGFSSPRKQLRNNLVAGFSCNQDVILRLFDALSVKHNARAQELSIHEWVELTHMLADTV